MRYNEGDALQNMEDKERGQLKNMEYYINVYGISPCRMFFGHLFISLDIRWYNINFPSSSFEKLFLYKVFSIVPLTWYLWSKSL